MPTDLSGDGFPRPLASILCPTGWKVFVERFYDVVETLHRLEPDIRYHVRSMDTAWGFLGFTVGCADEKIERLILETVKASLASCVVCSRSAKPRTIKGWCDNSFPIGVEVPLCDEHLQEALANGATEDGTEAPGNDPDLWNYAARFDRPWYPGKDQEDDEDEGLRGDEPGSAVA